MKKLAACILACLLMFGSLSVLAEKPEQGVSLFTPWFGTTINVPGVYATTLGTDILYTGPGAQYYHIAPFEVNFVNVRCMALTKDSVGQTWVLVEIPYSGTNWCGYIPFSTFSWSSQKFLKENLPYESSYDELTPTMIAQFYLSCDGHLGPGEEYPMLFPLDAEWAEGTLIMTSGNWAMIELNEDTMERIGAKDAKCRVWVNMSNIFY